MRSLLTLKPTWDDNGKALVCVSKVPDFNEDHSRVVDLDISCKDKKPWLEIHKANRYLSSIIPHGNTPQSPFETLITNCIAFSVFFFLLLVIVYSPRTFLKVFLMSQRIYCMGAFEVSFWESIGSI